MVIACAAGAGLLIASGAPAHAAVAQQAYVKASNPGSADYFGHAVAISGDTMVVGAPEESSHATGVNGNEANDSALRSGAAYVYVRSGGMWTQQAYLKASNTEAFDHFGQSVAISGDTIVVGAILEASQATGVDGDQGDNSAPGAGAAYVFVRSGGVWSQQAYLKPSNTPTAGLNSFFGVSVAISGDTIVVGAQHESTGAPLSGAGYVFVREGGVWSQQAYLKASEHGNSDYFGGSVAVQNDTIVIGAHSEDSGATGVNGNPLDDGTPNAGAAYVFSRSGTSWIQQAYLKASEPAADDFFGASVSLSGDTILIGANRQGGYRGAAYTFVRTGATWTQEAFLKASNADPGDQFGSSVCLDGDTAVVGAPCEDSRYVGVNTNQSDNGVTDAGAAYVFTRTASGWSQTAYVKTSNTQWPATSMNASEWIGFAFGTSVALSGSTLVAGAQSEHGTSSGINGDQCRQDLGKAGAAYVFDLDGTLIAVEPEISVELPDGTSLPDGSSVVDFGELHPDNTGVRKLVLKNTGLADLALPEITITGPNAADFSVIRTGTFPPNVLRGGCTQTSLSVFIKPGLTGPKSATLRLLSNDADEASFDIELRAKVLSPGPISQQVYAKASNPGTSGNGGHWFGHSVALSGNTMAVGSPFEDSDATGINGDQHNDGAPNSGSAYVFVREGATWVQDAYLKASNAEADDQFGHAVSVSGDTIVVTAPGEDSAATGVNGNQTDNAAAGAGAAYVFVRAGSTWTQQAYLKPSDTRPRSGFGAAVAVFGDTIIVSATTDGPPGSAYIFVRDGTTWTQQAILKATNADAGDQFGYSVALSADTAVIGALREDSSATGVNGDQSNNLFGNSGAAYVFVREATTWTQQAYLKASNTDRNDYFGWSVAITGDILVVGAPYEDSNATGINGDQSKNTALDSGAAYVFTRAAGVWTQGAYLKPDVLSSGGYQSSRELFGAAVSISGDTIVVGGEGEDNFATGVNGGYQGLFFLNSGAAWVFLRNGTTWNPEAYLKASNIGLEDAFGWSLAISGDTVVVAAPREDSSAAGLNGDQSLNPAPGYDAGAVYVFTGLGTDPSPSALEQWRVQYFGNLANSGAGADEADPDADGHVNFMEFSTGGHPLVAGSPPATVAKTPAGIDFTYTRSKASLGEVGFRVEWSDTLAPDSWSSDGINEVILGDNGTVQQVEARVPSGASGQRFVRLRVSGEP